MRINIYEEEMTDEVRLVEKTASDIGLTFFGCRFFLKSPPELHATDQDDRSAVTFWFAERDLCEAFTKRIRQLLKPPIPPATLKEEVT